MLKLSLAMSAAAFAQEPAPSDEDATLEVVSVLGTRSKARSATDSAVPLSLIHI